MAVHKVTTHSIHKASLGCGERDIGHRWMCQRDKSAATFAAEVKPDVCCTSGYEWASLNQDCTSLPSISDSKQCRVIQEQCCLNQLEELHCTSGINVATEKNSCDTNEQENSSSCESRFLKRCCNCCLLGKEAQARGESCDQAMFLGYQCSLVFRACCVKGQDGNETPNQDEGGGPCTQQCRDTGSSVVCSCYAGYQLQPDGVTCEDINECIAGTHNCKVGQICINQLGSFRCQREINCGTGYELTEDNTCKDIDECATGTHNCLPTFNCQNTAGSFRCRPKMQCSTGYIQDALGNCIDINECLSVNAPCPQGQTCINTEGSYTCQRHVVNCGRGYHLSADGRKCEDINECSGSQNPCGEGHTCLNVPGTFRCECQVGYHFDTLSRTCVDINECRGYSGRICAHKCENTAGSFYCSCSTGFKLALDGRTCEDVDECSSNPCSQECANVYGSYQCYCRRGYQLSDVDGITCEDIWITYYRLACGVNNWVDNRRGQTPERTCLIEQSISSAQLYRGDNTRCIKSCRPNDFSCITDPVHSISNTVLSLPTSREFNHAEEIIFLRAVTPAYSPGPQPDIIFHIIEGNVRDSFDIQKRYMDGTIVGVVRQTKPIVGPFQTVLKLEMNYVVGGVVSHKNVVNVHIFVSEFWF
ncbi:hypothetical protein GDO81_011090 [Engystomops pustulosus]|uniref:Fibulin-1 n=1 Tax=Engystomops pustulosus TaxID=76066 RepID=A0AAV7C5G5_ENGPU|nr:hypothetical protein GDO81_011090 [Engystomops pustulosus]